MKPNGAVKNLIYFVQAIIGWTVFVPLSFIIPKKKDLIILIGRNDGDFIDSIKYFYIYCLGQRSDFEYYFLTSHKKLSNILNQYDLPNLYYPSWKTVFTLLRANILVVDNWSWIQGMKYHMLFNTKKIQIWHGIPLKQIELDDPIQINQMKNPFYFIKNKLGGKYPWYHALISTSEYFTENSFKKAFKTDKIIETGYPRNDVFFNNYPELTERYFSINIDVKSQNLIDNFKNNKYTIVLYAPTFRDTGGDAVSDNCIKLETLNEFAVNNNLCIIFKFHPNPNFQYDFKNYNNIIFYNNTSDIYPVLPQVDILVTDYSSIYFDFLLLDRPIIFFPYDIDKYVEKDRNIGFEYNKFTPGPKCYTQNALQKEILSILKSEKDEQRAKRGEMLDLSFKFKDGKSSERIYEYICKYFL